MQPNKHQQPALSDALGNLLQDSWSHKEQLPEGTNVALALSEDEEDHF